MNYAMASPAAMTGNTYDSLPPTPVVVPCELVGIPLPVLTCLADISTALSRLAGKEPMLTRSKIRELTHADWSASNNRISEDINWFPGISLEHALRNGLF